MNIRTLGLCSIALGAIALAAGCGGGTTGVPTVTSNAAIPATTSIPLSGSSSQELQVTAGSATATFVVPAAASGAGAILTVAGSSTQPAGTAAMLERRRALPAGATVLAFLTVSSSSAVTFASSASLAFLLPGSVSTAGPTHFYVAELKPGANSWIEPWLGPGTVSGQVVSFGIGAQALALSPGGTYVFALYSAVVTATATPSAPPSGSPSGSPSATPTATPTVPPLYTFEGSSSVLTLTQGVTPGAGSLAAYQNVTVAVQFAAPSASGSLDLSDALDDGDITPAGFPADNATNANTPVIYVSVVNPGTGDIAFGGNVPSVTVTKSTGFGSMTACNLDVFENNGAGASWQSPGVSGTISGTSVTVGPATIPNGTVDFEPGQQLIAVSCH